MLPDTVPSSFGGVPARKLRSIPVGPLIAGYLARYGYDASECFSGIAEIGLYECPQTGMLFYFPFETAGPEALYQQLQTFDWNYKTTKWEHDIALKLVAPGMKVLDVGCGEGSFLSRSKALGAIPTGIEFNRQAAAAAQAKGVEVLPTMLSEHAVERPETYDLVTSFQVLEHVVDPHAFIECSIRVLKPGSRLVIGVPNQGSFLGQTDSFVLNMPPHHMTLWDRASLEALASVFPMKLDFIEFEPLQEHDWYRTVMERRYLTGWLQRKLYYKLGGDKLFARFIADNAHTIHGHTVLAVFTKR